ncbi:class I SAM-dependent methyltransferase [Methanococcoides alaskense]|uniref:SAM-dependent methyltransferase n=1 Tax=Methanococcoides alaskense TaxID=325778 RepID=A0AA90U0M2_9EURY|nr:class I SAM-dependent methyltransferase [Methanococcoides alaskense]MDR6223497.1 SAM-dependent methyltransferase [Methanococcoides alaskense]
MESEEDIFLEMFDRLPRQGPGKDECTRKAYSMLSDLQESPHILDVGCGSGRQTLVLAEISKGHIDALDLNGLFLDDLNERARENGFSENIRTFIGSMIELPFEKENFDLIWAEGAIYIMGFKEGLSYWKQFLKKSGYIAVTEITWLKSSPSARARSFWDNYPEVAMGTIEEKKAIISDIGLDFIGSFVLPEKAWWDDYYVPLEKRLEEMKIKYEDNPVFAAIAEETYAEIDMYRECSDDYGYVFYIMQKKE